MPGLRHDLFEEVDRLTRGGSSSSLQYPRLQVQVVRFNIRRIAPLTTFQFESQLVHDGSRDLILNGEDVLQLAVEPLRPEGNIVSRAHELRVDAQVGART